MNLNEYKNITVFLDQTERLERNWRNWIVNGEAKQNQSNLKNTRFSITRSIDLTSTSIFVRISYFI